MLKFLFFLSLAISMAVGHKDPLYRDGRSVMVHLFEWKWDDIAAECERFLGPKGYAGVQISPPQEHCIASGYPWWQRYQPVSYRLISRSGNEQQFINMVNKCNAVGVNIYVDAIINHMTNIGNTGNAGSTYNVGQRSYPAVPYSSFDFNDRSCSTANGEISNYQNVNEVRNCRLNGMPDLATGNEYVRNKIADYMNRLIDIGVAGFRIDAAKHMWPEDLRVILSKLKNARADVFGANKRPFVFMEVIDQGFEPIKSTHYTHLGRVTEFKYSLSISDVFRKKNNQKLVYLKNFGTGWGFITGDDSLVFLDNHDNQRGHGGAGSVITHKEPRLYKMANAYASAWPYAVYQIISSYTFSNGDQGPPSNNGNTNTVQVNADDTCSGGWICEHRWRQVYNMARFKNIAGFEPVANWWDNGSNQIAFSRGNKAFLAINNEAYTMDVTLQTGLPAGNYCDIISGNKINNACTGKTITVGGDGRARFNIPNNDDPVAAIHIESKL